MPAEGEAMDKVAAVAEVLAGKIPFLNNYFENFRDENFRSRLQIEYWFY